MNEQNVENQALAGDAIDLRQKVYVVGTDEAGYGPNLGPLVVGASCWQIRRDGSNDEEERVGDDKNVGENNFVIDESSRKKARNVKTKTTRDERLPLFEFSLNDVDVFERQVLVQKEFTAFERRSVVNLFRRANGSVERLNAALSKISDRRGIFPLVDSKKLYGASKSLAALERSFWLAALLTKVAESRREILTNATFRRTLQLVAEEDVARIAEERKDCVVACPPWELDVDFPLPFDSKTNVDNIFQTLNDVENELVSNDVKLLDLSARRVQPREFNALVDELGLKSNVVAEVTTTLVVETIIRTTRFVDATPPLFIVLCDKLGGRDRYATLLSARFPGANVETVVESRGASVYRFAARRGVVGGKVVEFLTEVLIEFRFTAKGESNIPTALASIVAKYFRELSMIPFNEFWRRETNVELRPTAGYPLDARRFSADVDEARRRLEIADDVFWRKK